MNEMVLVVDFGGQYNQLIARRVRESHVYSEIVSYKKAFEAIREKQPRGIILTGGPNSVYLPDSPTIGKELFSLGVPVLGICYGAQLMTHVLGGRVCRAPEREYGKTLVHIDAAASKLFEGVQADTVCWMSHNDYIEAPAWAAAACCAPFPAGWIRPWPPCCWRAPWASSLPACL